MTKVYKNRKKHINPRYFLSETIEEAVVTPGTGTFPGVSSGDRAKKLAQDAEQHQISKAAGEPQPPWENQDEPGSGFADVSLSEADYDVLKRTWALAFTDDSNMAEKFSDVMEKLGVSLQGRSDTGTDSQIQAALARKQRVRDRADKRRARLNRV